LSPVNLVSPSPAAPAAKPVIAPSLDDGDFSLESLAAMDASVVAVAAPVSSGFEDEIEATAPDRDLPPELTAQQINFVEQLDGVYPLLADPELFAQSIRIIMIELQENPEYIKLVADQDVHVMIQGMRRSMGLARIKKQEKSRKTTTPRATKQKKSGVSADDLALLDSIMGGDDD